MHRVFPLVALSLAFAPAPEPKSPAEVEISRLRGTWRLVSETQDGKDKEVRKLSLAFFKDHLELTDEKGTHRWELSLDPKATPPTFDLRTEADGGACCVRFVYRLDGNTLITCYNMDPPHTRPADLSGKANQLCRQVFQRQKR
jgi:uncharacterized protein (TIGR03067 family)